MSCYQVKEAPRRRKPRGCGPGPRRAPARGASGPGPRSPSGGPPVPHGSSAALRRHQAVCGAVGLAAAPFAHSGGFPPRLRRGPPPPARAARRCPPLRSGRAPGSPPALPLGLPAPSLRCGLAVGARCGRLASGSRCARLRAPCSVALAPLRAPLRASAPARRVPPARVRFAASARAASRPGGPRGCAALPGGSAPRAFFGARAALAALRFPVSGVCFSWTGRECSGQLVRPGPSRCQRFRPVRCMGVRGPSQCGWTGGGRLSVRRRLVPPPPSFAIDTLARLR